MDLNSEVGTRSSCPKKSCSTANAGAASSSTSPASASGPVSTSALASSWHDVNEPNMVVPRGTTHVATDTACSWKGTCARIDSEHNQPKPDSIVSPVLEDTNRDANTAHASANKHSVRWGVSEDAIEALRASVWWMCPRSFMSAVCAGMRTLDEAVEIAYWKTALSAECGVAPDLLDVSGPNTAQHWRRIFLDFETKPRRICSTEEDYARMFPSYDGDTSILPKGMEFRDNGTTLVDFGRHGDRCVVADALVPSGTSATLGTPDPRTGKYTVDYRRAHHYYFEVCAKLNTSDDPTHAPRAAFPRQRTDFCFSIGFASARTKPHRLARIQAGWAEHTWGLHSDDGNIFSGHGQSEQHFCDGFGPGQVVGAGIMHAKNGSSRCLFFTLDGVFLGLASEIALPPHGGLIPICGVDCRWELEFNFGEKPFTFDLERNFGEPEGGISFPAEIAVDAEGLGPWMIPARWQPPNQIMGQVANLMRGHPLDRAQEEPLNPNITDAQPVSQKLDDVSMLIDAQVSNDEGGLPQYGPVWPWHKPAAIRPAGIHFNPRQFMGTWITSASDSWIGNYLARTRVIYDLLYNSEDERDMTDSEGNDSFGDFEPELWSEPSDEEYDEISVESFVADSDAVSVPSHVDGSDTSDVMDVNSDPQWVDPDNENNKSNGNSGALSDASFENIAVGSDDDVQSLHPEVVGGENSNSNEHTEDHYADAASIISHDNILADSDHSVHTNGDENLDVISYGSGDHMLLDADHSVLNTPDSAISDIGISDGSGDDILIDSDHNDDALSDIW